MYAIRHPIRTLLQSVFGLAIFGVIYLVAYKGAETSALLAQESVGPLEVLGLFPPLPLLVPIVVVAVVFITVASILGNARRDAEFGRWR